MNRAISHHLIANQFVDDCVAPHEDFGSGTVKPIKQGGVGTRIQVLAQCGSAAHIGEEHCDVYFGSAGRKDIAATRAEIGILA
jgi:hypothetical protein